MDAELSREDFAIRITRQTDLRKTMDTKLKQLEAGGNKEKQDDNQGNTVDGPVKKPESDRTKKQVPHKRKDTQPKRNAMDPEMKTMMAEDVTSMAARGEITLRETEERWEEIGKRFQRK